MNSDTAVSGVMLTIVMIILATLFSGIMLTGMSELQKVNDGMFNDGLRNADIEIIFAGKSSTTQAKIWIKNLGEAKITPAIISKSTLLFGPSKNFKIINYGSDTAPSWTFTIVDLDEDGKWGPQETLEITVSWGEPLTSGDYYVKFSLYRGGEDIYFFEII